MGTKIGRPKRERRPMGFWKEHTSEIVADLRILGEYDAKRKWKIPNATWNKYAPAWRQLVKTALASRISARPEDICGHVCDEMLILRGFRQAMLEMTELFRMQWRAKNDTDDSEK